MRTAAPVTVVVVTYNSEAVIEGLLDSLPGAAAGVPIEVVVVDNSSTDGTAALLRTRERAGDLRMLLQPNHGYAAGINAGVAASSGTGPILVLNPDTRVKPGALPALLRWLGPGVGVAAPRIINPDGTVFASQRRQPSLLRSVGLGRTGWALFSEEVRGPDSYERTACPDWALGAALLVSRECHERLGGWDESFFLYSEETDLCLRARDAGLRTVFVPDAVVTHIGGASGRSATTYAIESLNRVRLYRRRHDPVRSAAFYALALLTELSRVVRGRQAAVTALRSLLRLPRARGALPWSALP